MTELILNSGEFIDESDSVFDLILNRLDLRHTNGGKSFLYDPDEFRKALPEFLKTIPVFAKVHPQNIGNMLLEDALQEVDGRVVGSFQDVSVNNPGTLFKGKLSITDPEAKELAKQGKLLISTAFSATPDNNGVLRDITPNHVLLYPLEPGSPMPGDQAAMFLLNQKQDEETKNGDVMPEEKNGKELDLVKELVQNQAARDELQTKVNEQSETIHNQSTQLTEKDRTIAEKDGLISQKDELITNQKSEIEALNGRITELEKTISENKETAKKARRDRIFNTYSPGTQKAFESRKADLYDDEKYEELIFAMNQHKVDIKEPPTEESGVENVENQNSEQKKDQEASNAWEISEVRL
jgi:uncharacterized coiled-coil protein SlyX